MFLPRTRKAINAYSEAKGFVDKKKQLKLDNNDRINNKKERKTRTSRRKKNITLFVSTHKAHLRSSTDHWRKLGRAMLLRTITDITH